MVLGSEDAFVYSARGGFFFFSRFGFLLFWLFWLFGILMFLFSLSLGGEMIDVLMNCGTGITIATCGFFFLFLLSSRNSE